MHLVFSFIHSKFLLAIFFVSGLISLVYQIAWQKALSQIIGVDAYSITLIVSIFMLGLGIGAIVGGTLTRSRINLLWLYMMIETILGVFGFFSVPLLRFLNTVFHTTGGGYVTDFIINFSLLLWPTLLMGMTLPIVIHVFRDVYPVGKAVGIVYSANIAGAALGTIAAGFLLIGTIGITNTCRLMSILNFILAFSVFTYIRSQKKNASAETLPEHGPHLAKNSPRGVTKKLVILSLLSGFVALSYEIIFFRIFTTYFGATSYVFPILITSYLIMMALGNNIFGSYSDKKSAEQLFIIAATFAILSTILILWGQEILFRLGLRADYLLLWQSRTWLPFAQIPLIFFVSLVLMIPVAFVSGFFPVIVRLATLRSNQLGATVGYIYFTQTIGNFFGAIISGLVLLPLIGTSLSLRLMGVLLLALPFIIVFPTFTMEVHSLKQRILIPLALMALIIYPSNFYKSVRRVYNGSTVVQPAVTREGAIGATMGYTSLDGTRMEVLVGRMFSNSILLTTPKYNECFPWYQIATIQNVKPKRALYIGLGTGAGPLCIQKLFPDIKIEIVEINPELMDMMWQYSTPEILDLLRSSTTYIADGRRFIQQNPKQRYDLIQVGVFNAWCAGCGNLFTEEFFTLLSNRLADGGILTYNAYPPAVKAGLDVFPNLVLFSPGTHAISDVIARKNASIELLPQPSQFIERLLTQGLIEPATTPLKDGCLIPRETVAKMTTDIIKATDDKPATEYFLTNNQFIYRFDWWRSYKPPRDMRIFECGEQSQPFRTLIQKGA